MRVLGRHWDIICPMGRKTEIINYPIAPTKKGHFSLRNNPLCRERGSNPHAVRHWFLRPACLPYNR